MQKTLLYPFTGAVMVIAGLLPISAAPVAVPTRENVRYVGSINCQSSMCHGGASPQRCQFNVWAEQDDHSRAYATLTTARSTLMAKSLGLASAVESSRCTSCHAPYQCLPKDELSSGVNVADGVSCEHCHNAADFWLRGHTRPDWTYADRIHAGMRDLRDTYVRASTCVACHQVLDADILAAGHPELIFELDGQTASEPRHWREKESWLGPKAWLVGQALALRNISQGLGVPSNSDKDLIPQEKALAWLLGLLPFLQPIGNADDTPSSLASWSNQVAHITSDKDWSPGQTLQSLTALSATSESFLDSHVSHLEQTLRAERLVLGLDRLSKSLTPSTTDAEQSGLSALFAAVQNRDQFDPKKFSILLQQFADVVSKRSR